MVDLHRGSAKHQKGFLHEKASTQTFLKTPIPDFAEKVTKAFLCADILLHKLRNSHLSSLFKELGNPLPSEGKCRSKVEKLAEEEALRLKDYLKDQEMFMVVDESDIKGKEFLNILVGKLTALEKTLLFNCETLSQSVNSNIVTREIDDAVYSLSVARKNFCLLLTDGARYMTTAGVLLKKLYPRLFQVTCMAYLLHNCAMKVRANYPAVDELVARVKAVTVKNRSRRVFFISIGQSPQPVVTRWGSWLTAAFYYSRNLPEVRKILKGFHDGGVVVRRAQEAVKAPNLDTQLVEIEEQYIVLVETIQKIQDSRCTIREAYQKMTSLDFGVDGCQIGRYIQKRMSRNDINCIVKMGRGDISPHLYSLLSNSQATSASVERSFSILRKFLARDRNLKDFPFLFYFYFYFLFLFLFY